MTSDINNSARETEWAATTLAPAERMRLEQVEGVVFNIQRYSLHDGPGVRTNVFLKGCPLHCAWCANPESQYQSPELALYEHQCIQCGQFDQACPVGWGAQMDDDWTDELRERYSARAAVCPAGAMHWMGERRTASDVIKEVLRDVPFYGEAGGMTLTGGEPTLQPQMAEALLRLARSEGISNAMETCGHTPWRVLEPLLPYLDLILYDLKHIDSEIHRVFTGVGNKLILSNLRRLAALDAPLVIRIPLIPGFNATEPSVTALAKLVRDLDGAITTIDLLPYHTLGRAKHQALGREYRWAGQDRMTAGEVEVLAAIIESFGLTVNVGG